MNLNQPMTWTDFKKMPEDVQKEYVQKYVDLFDCKIVNFMDIFGVKHAAIKQHLEKIGFDTSIFKAGSRMCKENKERFSAWLHPEVSEKSTEKSKGEVKTVVKESVDDVIVDENVANATKIEKTSAPSIMGIPTGGGTRISLDYDGVPDCVALGEALNAFAAGGHVHVSILVDRVVDW